MIPHAFSAARTLGSVKSIPPGPRPPGRLDGAPLGWASLLGMPPRGDPLGGPPLGIPLGRSGTLRPAALRQEMILVNCSRLP